MSVVLWISWLKYFDWELRNSINGTILLSHCWAIIWKKKHGRYDDINIDVTFSWDLMKRKHMSSKHITFKTKQVHNLVFINFKKLLLINIHIWMLIWFDVIFLHSFFESSESIGIIDVQSLFENQLKNIITTSPCGARSRVYVSILNGQ